ncbi:membrane protein [Leucobacter komagatae]|uniref:Membrane protein n=1 Tax=Leucobacter komagatae TaxID=55969 RepID=A0A542Y6W6_9MICO|nr:YhjD/YihY/BrkB family envelope integrity protein [Leucobacter komagatae]TQL43828.1 membrane protein [Leucobacter komagatae]
MNATPQPGVIARGMNLWQRIQRTRPYRTFSHFTDVGGSVLSGGMSYQALFAVFAGLVVGFSVFSIVLRNQPELLTTIIEQINVFVPGLLGESSKDAAVPVQSLLETRALDWTTLVAGLSLVWVAINWFTGTRRSIRIIFGLEVKEYRNAVLLKVRDFALAVGFFLAIIISAALVVVSSNLTDMLLAWLGVSADNWFFGGLGTVVRYGAMYVFDVFVLIAIHRYLAEVRIGWWNLVTGSMVGAAALFVLKLLGTALLGGATSNPLLAPFAIFVGLLLWFNFICRALLLTSAWIATGLDPKLGTPEAGQPSDAFRLLE